MATLDPSTRPQLEAAAQDETTVGYARDRLSDAIKALPPPAAPQKTPAKTK
jgi:hypothetical protein